MWGSSGSGIRGFSFFRAALEEASLYEVRSLSAAMPASLLGCCVYKQEQVGNYVYDWGYK
ncbi:hypothetical protein CR205_14775 [Alteribacter lacisalsi]|uniref:Uncharacterized protein n=1 Tax=Alteribacter lacisalsi TaxID=2045244 RepID=A0A2W0HHM8_9BACI|nr:hypothetical protein CR205_14775 [Alteribacter lacisalsi]